MDEYCLFQTHKIGTIRVYRSIATYKENISTKGVHDSYGRLLGIIVTPSLGAHTMYLHNNALYEKSI